MEMPGRATPHEEAGKKYLQRQDNTSNEGPMLIGRRALFPWIAVLGSTLDSLDIV
jgi:hypothetical protein